MKGSRLLRLASVRRWTILAFALSTLGSIAAVIVAWRVQRRALRAVSEGEERFRMFATTSRDLMRIRDAGGALLRFYTTARDVTERVELQAAAVTDELTGLLNGAASS